MNRYKIKKKQYIYFIINNNIQIIKNIKLIQIILKNIQKMIVFKCYLNVNQYIKLNMKNGIIIKIKIYVYK